MKKNQVNAILINQTRKRNIILSATSIIIAVAIFAISLLVIYNQRNEEQFVKYNEKSNIDYKVYLNDNDFFDGNYLNSNKQYIASLIKYINANFKYELSLEEKNVEYKYSYRIEADVNVKEKGTSNSLYNTTKTILEEKENVTSLNKVTIIENVDIDYNYYNNLIKKFISVYNLNDIESTLNINMYVNVIGTCEDFEEAESQESVMSLSIPLTTKTIAIDISNNLINTENNIMLCKEVYENNIILIVLSIILMILDLIIAICLIRYIIQTRTAEDLYERELKKILNNYSSYIQKLGNDFDFKEYQLLKVDTFNDMLEIRDTIRQPILMKENQDKTGAYFVIPSNTKLLYVYRLKISDIEREIQNKKEKDLEEF